MSRLPSDETTDRMKAASAAQHAAKRTLIAHHPIEYDALLEHERTKRGLPPLTQQRELLALRNRVIELEAELAKGDTR